MDFQVWDFPVSWSIWSLLRSWRYIWIFRRPRLGNRCSRWLLDAVARLNRTIWPFSNTTPASILSVHHKVDGLSEEYAPIPSKTLFSVSLMSSVMLVRERSSPLLPYFYLRLLCLRGLQQVIQKLIPSSPLWKSDQHPGNNCGFEKTYSLMFSARLHCIWHCPVDMSCYEMCSDYIDSLLNISELYSWDHPDRKPKGEQMREAESHVILQDSSMIHLMEMNKWVNIIIERSLQLRLELTMAWF